MARYHFDLADGEKIADVGGHDCEDIAEARRVADGLAERLAAREPDLVGRGYAIAVRDENGVEVYRSELAVPERLVN